MKSILILSLLFSSVVLFNGSTISNDAAIAEDGVEIRFEVMGEGEPAIIFVHGWAGDRTGWEAQVDYFSQNNRVVAIDLPGYGESGHNRDNWTMEMYGKDIAAVIEHLGIEKAVLVGHSMGSYTIVEAAKVIPEKLIGLVPVDVFHNVERELTDEQINQSITRRMEFVNNPTEEMMLRAYGDIDSATVQKKIQEYLSVSKVGWEESLTEAIEWSLNDLTKSLAELKTPIICINSDRYPMELAIARKYAPMFDAKIVKDVGHGVMSEAPEEFNRLLEENIKEFLKN